MIVEAIFNVVGAFLAFVVGLFPTRDPASWVSSMGPAIQTVWNAAAGMGAWIPWSNVSAVVQAVIGAMLTGLAIRLIRVVLSLFTGGGGSAA